MYLINRIGSTLYLIIVITRKAPRIRFFADAAAVARAASARRRPRPGPRPRPRPSAGAGAGPLSSSRSE